MNKKVMTTAAAIMLALSLAACGANNNTNNQGEASAQTTAEQTETVTTTSNTENNTTVETVTTTVNTTTDGALDTTDMFTDRDLEQSADLTDAVYMTVADGEDIEITAEGVYVISGNAAEVTITVDVADEEKVQIVLDCVTITNTDFPCIYVKSADKVFVTTAEGTTNALTVTGSFTADGDTNTDAVIFSKDDLVINGLGTLNVTSSDNGITSKDDLKVTGGTINIDCTDAALEANDSIRVADGTVNIKTDGDGLHAENDEDDSVGYIYICGGTITMDVGDDGIHATTIFQMDGGTLTIDAAEAIEATVVQINDGDIDITATDDGINGSQKSTAYSIAVEINGGNISINMGQGDTDAIDSNGDLIINGGTINITAQSPFDYDGVGQYNGGTIIVNGQQIDSLSNQMMGPGGMDFPSDGMNGQGGGPGGQPGGGMGGRGGRP